MTLRERPGAAETAAAEATRAIKVARRELENMLEMRTRERRPGGREHNKRVESQFIGMVWGER